MSESTPIRVMVVDDHPMVRRGLTAFLSTMAGMVLVAEAKDGREAIDRCETSRPDVILMDLVMPHIDGPRAIREIRRRWPQTQVVAITSFEEESLVHQALQAGAIAYLLKDVSAPELEAAIRAAHAGRAMLTAGAAQALIHSAVREPAPGHDLTPREREVLTLIVEGLNNQQIARRLNITRATVSVHVSHILGKLGVSNRVEATTLALRQKLVD